jgi:hypothetical protein
MTSSPHGPYVWGDTHATMTPTMRSDPAMGSESHKRRPSADWGLQLAPMKAELLVTAYQPWRGECVPGPCTHRPSRHGSCQGLKSVGQPAGEAAAEGRGSDWDEVVTR